MTCLQTNTYGDEICYHKPATDYEIGMLQDTLLQEKKEEWFLPNKNKTGMSERLELLNNSVVALAQSCETSTRLVIGGTVGRADTSPLISILALTACDKSKIFVVSSSSSTCSLC